MTTFYIVLKVIALLAIIIIPLKGPGKKKVVSDSRLGSLAVSENGYLEHFPGNPADHHPVE